MIKKENIMKTITIYQENSDRIIIYDDDSSDLISYTKKISEIMESTKVCILETSSGIISLKPSKLNSILIEEVQEKKVEVEKNETIQQDIIKD